MDQRHAAEDGPVFDMDVPRETAIVCEYGMAADLAIVREVHVCHDPVVVADPGHPGVLHRAAVDRYVFSNRVAVADLDRRVFARVLLVLRRGADRREGIDVIVPSNSSPAVDQYVRFDACSGADFGLGTDDRKGAYGHIRRQLRLRMNDRRRMDHAPSSPNVRPVQRISASATIASSTRAAHENFQMLRLLHMIATSISSWSPGTTGFLKRALSMPA